MPDLNDRRTLIALAAAGSAALLLGAYAFQAAGYAPCRMCYWQRWPHLAAVALGGAALVLSGHPPAQRALAALGALAALTTAGLGLFHAGVERGWWPGPSSCTGGGLGGLSGADLLSLDAPAPIMCDQVSWALAGLSMASWNALLSLALAAIWLCAAFAPARRPAPALSGR